MKFHGAYEEVKDIVHVVGVFGDWADLGSQKQFRAESRAILNWWPNTGTVTFQGKYPACDQLRSRLGPEIERRRGSVVDNRPSRPRDPEVPF